MQDLEASPAQLLMSRRTKTLLPTRGNLLSPQIVENVNKKITESKARQAHYYNRGAKDMENLRPGDTVRIKPAKYHNEWKLGEVKRQVATRSYEIVDENNSTLRRNRSFLHKTPENKPAEAATNELDMPSADAQERPVSPGRTHEPQRQARITAQPELRHSGRACKPPKYLQDYVA